MFFSHVDEDNPSEGRPELFHCSNVNDTSRMDTKYLYPSRTSGGFAVE